MSLTLAATMAMQQMQDSQTASNVMAQGIHSMDEEQNRMISRMQADEAETRTDILKQQAGALQRLSFN